MRARCARKVEALLLVPLDAAVNEVPEDCGERARENHEVDEPERRLDHGKGEHIKRDVFMEDRIGFPKRLLVEHEQDLLPLPSQGQSTKNPENYRGSDSDDLAKRLDRVAEPRDRDVFTGDGHDLRPVLVAHPQAYENRGGNSHEPHEEQDPLRHPLLHEEVVEAELVEPHVARRNLGEPCKRHDQRNDHDECDRERRNFLRVLLTCRARGPWTWLGSTGKGIRKTQRRPRLTSWGTIVGGVLTPPRGKCHYCPSKEQALCIQKRETST